MSDKSIADKHYEELLAAGIVNVPVEKIGWTPQVSQNVGPTMTVASAPVAVPNEIRIKDPETGGEKGSKLARFDLIPEEFETALAEHYGKGATKYADRNWEKGYKWGLSYAALRRHLAAWLRGESIDPETGSNHLIAAAWHCVALYIFETRGLGKDDLRRSK